MYLGDVVHTTNTVIISGLQFAASANGDAITLKQTQIDQPNQFIVKEQVIVKG